jgi:hypothetical protein
MALTKQKKTPLSRSPLQQQSKADNEGKEAAGGILLEKEGIQLIYKALRIYPLTTVGEMTEGAPSNGQQQKQPQDTQRYVRRLVSYVVGKKRQ